MDHISKTALVLFAHGARDPEWSLPMQRVLETIRSKKPYQRVELAFLEFIAPNLKNCVECLVLEGFERIAVVPMFIAQGGHIKREVPLLLEELRKLHPQVSFEQARVVGEAESVIQAMTDYVLSVVEKES